MPLQVSRARGRTPSRYRTYQAAERQPSQLRSPTRCRVRAPPVWGPVNVGDGFSFAADIVARGVHAPAQLAWLPDGRLFVAEANGLVRVVRPGEPSRDEPALDAPALLEPSPIGPLGLAPHPDFPRNRFVYVSFLLREQPDTNPAAYRPPARGGRHTRGAGVTLRSSGDHGPSHAPRATRRRVGTRGASDGVRAGWTPVRGAATRHRVRQRACGKHATGINAAAFRRRRCAGCGALVRSERASPSGFRGIRRPMNCGRSSLARTARPCFGPSLAGTPPAPSVWGCGRQRAVSGPLAPWSFNRRTRACFRSRGPSSPPRWKAAHQEPSG